jgi:hypothetical protein
VKYLKECCNDVIGNVYEETFSLQLIRFPRATSCFSLGSIFSFLIYHLSSSSFNIILLKIPLLISHAVSFLSTGDILQIIVEVEFIHLCNSAWHSLEARKASPTVWHCVHPPYLSCVLGVSLQHTVSTLLSAVPRVHSGSGQWLAPSGVREGYAVKDSGFSTSRCK